MASASTPSWPPAGSTSSSTEEAYVNPLLSNPLKRVALSLIVFVTIFAFFPIVVVLKIGEAIYLCSDIGTNCLRSAWSDRW